MLTRPFGTTGLTVSALGLGAGQVGQASVSEPEAARLLNGALDLGITLVDTATSYGLSEWRIGRHLASRRAEFVLSSKCGWPLGARHPQLASGDDPMSVRAASAAIDASLRRLRTDVIDIYHLHSNPLGEATSWVFVEALDAARAAGKVRVVAYSGENADLQQAIASERFGSVETSVNIADQHSVRDLLPPGIESGLGVIAKRPIANAPWRHDERPEGVYGVTYWDRLRQLAYDVDLAPAEFALRFSAFAPGVSSAITGTANPDNLRANAETVEQGPLPREVLAHVAERWGAVGRDWAGEI